eukprot:361814-Chlamydomonas_euryale.AAC.5
MGCIGLHGGSMGCMALHGLHGVAWAAWAAWVACDAWGCMELHADAWGCIELHADAWGCMGYMEPKDLQEDFFPLASSGLAKYLSKSAALVTAPTCTFLAGGCRNRSSAAVSWLNHMLALSYLPTREGSVYGLRVFLTRLLFGLHLGTEALEPDSFKFA